MKAASVYRRGGKIMVHSKSKTTVGVWISEGPCIRLPHDCSNEELSKAIITSLQASQEHVPHPNVTQRKRLVDPLLAAAGVKSWRTFTNGAEYVSILQNGQAIQVTPWKNLGPRQGFVERIDESVTVSLDCMSDIGLYARKSLGDAI